MGKLVDPATLLIQDIERMPFQPNGWRDFAYRLSQIMHGPVILGSINVKSGKPVRIDQVMLSDQAIADYRSYFYDISPWRQWLMAAEQGAVAAGKAINPLSPESYVNTKFYQDFLLPNRMHHGISSRIARDSEHVLDLAVLRPKQAGAIDPAELRLMQRLVPHFRIALRVRRLLERAQQLQPGRITPSVGLLMVDRTGRILFHNPTAHEWLAEGDALTVRYGRLVAKHEGAQPLFARLLKIAADGTTRDGIGGDGNRPGGEMLLPRPPLSPLRVTIAAAPLTGEGFGQVSPAALVLLRAREPMMFPRRIEPEQSRGSRIVQQPGSPDPG